MNSYRAENSMKYGEKINLAFWELVFSAITYDNPTEALGLLAMPHR